MKKSVKSTPVIKTYQNAVYCTALSAKWQSKTAGALPPAAVKAAGIDFDVYRARLADLRDAVGTIETARLTAAADIDTAPAFTLLKLFLALIDMPACAGDVAYLGNGFFADRNRALTAAVDGSPDKSTITRTAVTVALSETAFRARVERLLARRRACEEWDAGTGFKAVSAATRQKWHDKLVKAAEKRAADEDAGLTYGSADTARIALRDAMVSVDSAAGKSAIDAGTLAEKAAAAEKAEKAAADKRAAAAEKRAAAKAAKADKAAADKAAAKADKAAAEKAAAEKVDLATTSAA